MLVCPILATEFVCLGFLEVFIHHRGCKITGQLNESTRFWSCCTKLKIKTNTTSTGTSVAVVKNIKKVKMLPSGTPLFFGKCYFKCRHQNRYSRCSRWTLQYGDGAWMMTNDQLERERGIQPWGLAADKGPGLGHLVALFACGWVNAL